MSVKVLEEKVFDRPIHCMRGDVIRAEVTRKGKVLESVSAQIEKAKVIDRIILFEFEEEFGLREGHGAVFGVK